jgi:uncharacterized membrane protein YsdA (DUF1294 family)
MGISIAHLIYGLAAIVAIAYGTMQVHGSLSNAWWVAYLVAINGVAFMFYVYDKVLVGLLQRLHLRVPEGILVWGLALPGGIIGAIVAMYSVHHKTSPNKRDFRMNLLKAFIVQIIVLYAAHRWNVVSQEQVNDLVANMAGIVVNTVQLILTSVRAS